MIGGMALQLMDGLPLHCSATLLPASAWVLLMFYWLIGTDEVDSSVDEKPSSAQVKSL